MVRAAIRGEETGPGAEAVFVRFPRLELLDRREISMNGLFQYVISFPRSWLSIQLSFLWALSQSNTPFVYFHEQFEESFNASFQFDDNTP